jgi:Flp pilus assembly protein TadD
MAWTMIRAASILSTFAAAALLGACATTGADTAAAPEAAAQDAAIAGATPEERAAAYRLEPVSRAAFWNAEYSRNPADREAALEFSRALRAIGSAPEAAAVAEQAVRQNPGDADLLMALAAARVDEGRAPAAVGPLEQAIAAAPDDWRPYSLLGVSLDQMGRHEEARQNYLQALQVSPNNPAVMTNLGMSYAVAGDAANAELTLRDAAAQPDATAYTRQNLALVLAYQGKFEEAENLALVDLPVAAVRNNMDYARSMLSRARRWEDLQR